MKPQDFEALDKQFHMNAGDQETEADNEDVKAKDNAQDKARFERMKEEYEKLYSECIKTSIAAHREKHELRRQLKRAGVVSRSLSDLICDRRCLKSWSVDPRKYPYERKVTIGVLAVILILFIILASIIWDP